MNIPNFLKHGTDETMPDFHAGFAYTAGRLKTSFIDKGMHALVLLENLLTEPPAEGILRKLDPVIKLISAFLFLIAVSIIRSITFQLLISGCLLSIVILLTKINVTKFYKHILIIGFFFGFLLSFPSSFNFIVDGELALPILKLNKGYSLWIYHIPQVIGITHDGIERTALLSMRVINSVTITFLLLRTTYFDEIIKALMSLKVSSIFVTILMLTYRYIILFARFVEDFYLSKKARFLGRDEKYMIENWIGSRIHFLFRKTMSFSDEVSSAMKARLFVTDGENANAVTPIEICEDKQVLFKLEKINYSYNGNIPALIDVTLEIKPEERFAIIGANGTGKSTLLKIMAGLIHPISGNLFFKGQPVTKQKLQNIHFLRKFRGSIGFVFQEPDVQLFSATVFDELTYGPIQLGLSKEEAVARAEDVMNMLEIAELKDRPPYMLSGGEKKRVALGSVLTMNPEILILDEPTGGLDPKTQCFLMELMVFFNSQIKKTIIIATHDLSIVDELQAKVAVLGENHRIERVGTAEEILADEKLLLSVNLIHEHLHFHRDTVHRHLHAHTFFHKH